MWNNQSPERASEIFLCLHVTTTIFHHFNLIPGISAGLFGTNDNEAGNEWILPNHSFTDNVQEFTQRWQVRFFFFMQITYGVGAQRTTFYMLYMSYLDELKLDRENSSIP